MGTTSNVASSYMGVTHVRWKFDKAYKILRRNNSHTYYLNLIRTSHSRIVPSQCREVGLIPPGSHSGMNSRSLKCTPLKHHSVAHNSTHGISLYLISVIWVLILVELFIYTSLMLNLASWYAKEAKGLKNRSSKCLKLSTVSSTCLKVKIWHSTLRIISNSYNFRWIRIVKIL